MNAGPTSERVYVALKRQLLERVWRPGDRLDPSVIGETLNSSVTPVRDALNVLSGEQLVEARTSEGFHVASLDAPALEDLYVWNGEVLELAVKSWRTAMPSLTISGSDPSSRTASLFAAIGTRSDNAEHRRCILSLNDRLHAVRMTESELLAGIDGELETMTSAFEGNDARALRSALAGFLEMHGVRKPLALNVT
jgi:hypothetical protein